MVWSPLGGGKLFRKDLEGEEKVKVERVLKVLKEIGDEIGNGMGSPGIDNNNGLGIDNNNPSWSRSNSICIHPPVTFKTLNRDWNKRHVACKKLD
jgi:hypothetical protein